MKVLVTGNNGYIGPILTEILLEKGYEVKGLDTNYYHDCFIERRSFRIEQLVKDIRDVSFEDLKDVNYIIHLAGLSNDPLGELDRNITHQINFEGSLRLAKLAKQAGVKRFIFASSQSMYGISDLEEALDEDKSEKKPVTEYAKTKWYAEQGLKKLGSHDFIITCFRPSTVFGVSPNMRCDIVFNNLIAGGFTTKKIEIKSDGTPWRPVIHVRDVCKAFICGIEAPKELVKNESFNVGIKNGNYTVRELAEAAQKVVHGCELIFTGEHGKDSRTYKVSFDKIFLLLKDYYKPEWDLIRGGKEIVDFFDRINFTEEMFRGRICNRIIQLKHLVSEHKLDTELFWREFRKKNNVTC